MPEEDKNDGQWFDGFADDIKSSPEIQNFKGPEDLAKSFIHSQKLISQRHEGIGKDDTYEDFSVKAEKFYNIPKKSEDYKPTEDELFDRLGHKFKLHPELQLKPLKKELEESLKKSSDSEAEKKVDFWKEKTAEHNKEIKNKDEIIGRGIAKLGTTREKLEESLGSLWHHPEVNRMLLALGQGKGKGDDPVKTTSGSAVDRVSLEEDFKFVNQHLDNYAGPYYNKQAPDHEKIVRLVDEKVKKLSSYEQKNKVKFLTREGF